MKIVENKKGQNSDKTGRNSAKYNILYVVTWK